MSGLSYVSRHEVQLSLVAPQQTEKRTITVIPLPPRPVEINDSAGVTGPADSSALADSADVMGPTDSAEALDSAGYESARGHSSTVEDEPEIVYDAAIVADPAQYQDPAGSDSAHPPLPIFSCCAVTPCWRTSGSSLRSFPPWGRHRSRVRMFWVQSPRSFRTPWEPSDRRTGWLGHQSRLPRDTVIQSPARKRRHLRRLRQGHQSLIVWGLLLPPQPREQWHRSRPFALAPAGEPATDPILTAARRLLWLPQPDNIDGSQVGARLADFALHWRSLLGNCRATGIVEDGVGSAFQQRPQLTHQCISFRTRNSHQDLQQAVDALLLKGAIKRVTKVTSLGYYYRLFLVTKKTGDLRPVIDLSTLNRHMVVPHFKMETQGSVRSAIRSQEWTVSIDICDAYLHVPMHQAIRRSVFCTDFTYKIREYKFGLQNTEVELCQFCHIKYCCQNKAYLFWVANQSKICGILCLKTFKYLFNHQNIHSSLFHMW